MLALKLPRRLAEGMVVEYVGLSKARGDKVTRWNIEVMLLNGGVEGEDCVLSGRTFYGRLRSCVRDVSVVGESGKVSLLSPGKTMPLM